MIEKDDIFKFFHNECNASIESVNALYKLDITERIKKRKAINGITIDSEYKESKSGNRLRKALVKVNISDFKIGEYIVIHCGTPKSPISQCILYEILEDGSLLLAFSDWDNVVGVDSLVQENRSVEFILDKAKVDLREIYMKGKNAITEESLALINTIPQPSFAQNREELITELAETEESFKISLTDNQREAVLSAMLAKDYYLIQGPPGTGKSFVIAFLLIELLLYSKERVLVCGPNHLAINNVLSKLGGLSPNLAESAIIKVGQHFNTVGLNYIKEDSTQTEIHNIEYLNVGAINNWDVGEIGVAVGCTPFHMHTSRAQGLQVDTLIIDEAGQMNIGLALMAMSCAKRVILVGDHKQMAPIMSYEEHPEELRKSIFEHLYREHNCTTLDTTFRMNGPICNTVSSVFYNGVLKSAVSEQRLKLTGTVIDKVYDPNYAIVIKDIEHNGTNSSAEEAEFCVNSILEFIEKHKFNAKDIAVIAPFRAQCALVRKQLRKQKELLPDYSTSIIETVDRMQGQERDIIFISLTAGDLDYISELTNFIFNPNRFNVAISRAKNKLIIVGNITNIKVSMKGLDCDWLRQIFESENVTIL